MSMDFEPCTDEYLTRLWEHIDWKAAEEKLAGLQYQLTRAAYRKENTAIEELCKNRHPSPICTRFEHHLAGGLAPLSRTEAPRPYNWFSTAKL